MLCEHDLIVTRQFSDEEANKKRLIDEIPNTQCAQAYWAFANHTEKKKTEETRHINSIEMKFFGMVSKEM